MKKRAANPCSSFSYDARPLLALEVRIVGHDHVLVDAQRHVAVHLDQQGGLLDLLHRAVDASGRDDLVALFQPVAERLHLLAALGFGPPHEEPEDQHHEADHNDEAVLLHEARLRLCGRRCLKKIDHNLIRFLSVCSVQHGKYTKYRRICKPSLHLRFGVKPQRALRSGQRHVERFELPAPRAPRIEAHFDSLRIPRCDRFGVEFQRRAAAVAVVGEDGRRLRRIVGYPEAHDGRFARPEAAEADGVRPAPFEKHVRKGDDPAFPFPGPDRFGPVRTGLRTGSGAAARAEQGGRKQKRGGAAHGGEGQISPRPAFLMRPSAVSDSTILSSTPLMKVLLPGVE